MALRAPQELLGEGREGGEPASHSPPCHLGSAPAAPLEQYHSAPRTPRLQQAVRHAVATQPSRGSLRADQLRGPGANQRPPASAHRQQVSPQEEYPSPIPACTMALCTRQLVLTLQRPLEAPWPFAWIKDVKIFEIPSLCTLHANACKCTLAPGQRGPFRPTQPHPGPGPASSSVPLACSPPSSYQEF